MLHANKCVEFFDEQFQRQIGAHDYALNPFETEALAYLTGAVLDLGCGLGNLSLEAGRRGHRVVAVDASAAAVARINHDAEQQTLPVRAIEADVEAWGIDQPYDTIVAIGLVMFFPRDRALTLLRAIRESIKPGGRAVVNVLTTGTTFMGMFDGDNYCLFEPDELERHFEGWTVLSSRHDTFSAPGNTRKTFTTLIAEKP
jgi:tellurite methyltransferase